MKKEKIKIDWSKKDFIPKGLKVESVPRKELKPGDEVVVYGEIFRVLLNVYKPEGNEWNIQMIHTGDNYSKINERYLVFPNRLKMENRIIK